MTVWIDWWEMEKEVEGGENWSEAVEDLVASGEIESAISLLESVISNLQTLNPSDSVSQLQLASALSDLASLHSSKGFSLKADQLQSRACLIKQTTHSKYLPALTSISLSLSSYFFTFDKFYFIRYANHSIAWVCRFQWRTRCEWAEGEGGGWNYTDQCCIVFKRFYFTWNCESWW